MEQPFVSQVVLMIDVVDHVDVVVHISLRSHLAYIHVVGVHYIRCGTDVVDFQVSIIFVIISIIM